MSIKLNIPSYDEAMAQLIDLKDQIKILKASHLSEDDNYYWNDSAHREYMNQKHEINSLKDSLRSLTDALRIAADQLAGISLCLKTHGNNINIPHLIEYYEKCAKEARGVSDET